MEERTIEISKYIQARSQEIFHFTKQLDQKRIQQCKQPHQNVPKHMRRRAMSHNRYRIPFRIRSKMSEKEIDDTENAQDRIMCRKSIRKPKLLIKSYMKRDTNRQWLQTHLWHAKRMKMIDYFGYKIAHNPNDKSKRACYRFAKKECCIYDKSYYGMIFIKGNIKIIQEFLSNFIKNEQLTQIFNNKFNDKSYFGIDIYNELQEMGNLIGVGQFIWVKRNDIIKCEQADQQEEQLAILHHPGSKEELQFQFQEKKKQDFQYSSLQIEFIENNYNIFELIGPESMNKIALLCENLQFQFSEMQQIVQLFGNIPDPKQYPKQSVIHLNFKGEISKKLITPPTGFIQDIIDPENVENNTYQEEKIVSNEAINQSLISLMNFSKIISEFNKKTNTPNNSIWEDIFQMKKNQENDDNKFKITNRSRYTHRKRNKLSKKEKKEQVARKQEDKKKAKELNEENNNNNDENNENDELEKLQNENLQQNEQTPQMEEEKQIIIEKENQSFKIMVIISNHSEQNEYGTVQLIIPQQQGNQIWKLLNYLVCKPIGLRDYQSIQYEQGIKVFPDDYPTCQAYKELDSEKTNQEVNKYIRRPPSNRVNYQKINSPFPFRSDWNYIINQFYNDQSEVSEINKKEEEKLEEDNKLDITIQDLQEVKVEMVQRGIPNQKSYICLPLKEDLDKYYQLLQNKQPVSYIHKEINNKINNNEENIENDKEECQTEQNYETANKMSRKIIGYITNGGYSLF